MRRPSLHAAGRLLTGGPGLRFLDYSARRFDLRETVRDRRQSFSGQGRAAHVTKSRSCWYLSPAAVTDCGSDRFRFRFGGFVCGHYLHSRKSPSCNTAGHESIRARSKNGCCACHSLLFDESLYLLYIQFPALRCPNGRPAKHHSQPCWPSPTGYRRFCLEIAAETSVIAVPAWQVREWSSPPPGFRYSPPCNARTGSSA
jgi:hypothetical protein